MKFKEEQEVRIKKDKWEKWKLFLEARGCKRRDILIMKRYSRIETSKCMVKRKDENYSGYSFLWHIPEEDLELAQEETIYNGESYV